MNAPILTVTLNPALDVTTTTERLLPQQKLRCSEPRYDVGGGGANVSRAIRELGGESLAFVAVGGATGAHYRELLTAAALPHEIWPIAGETRTSMTVMEQSTGLHYRFVLPGPELPPGEADRILQRLSAIMEAGHRYVVGSGSLPPGVPADFYGRLAQTARAHGSRMILDTHGVALQGAIAHKPWLIRLNHLEAQELVGGEADTAVHTLADRLVAQQAAEIVIITRGDKGAMVRTATESFEIAPPLVKVRSAVGAGDSFVAALTVALSRDWPLVEAVRYGVAAAASAVTGEATDLCKRGDVDRYFAEIGGTPGAPGPA
jgi:6-phosphofructokinase 2